MPRWYTRNRLSDVIVVAGAVTLLLAILAVVWWQTGDREEPGSREAMLRVLNGTTEVRAGGAGQWARAGDLSTLAPGDEIRVAADGLAAIQLFEGSLLRLEDGARIKLARLEAFGEAGLERETAVEIAIGAGRMAIRAAERLSPESTFVVVTPSSAGAVQGTVFEIEVSPEGETRWRVDEGIVRIAAITVDAKRGAVAGLVKAEPGAYLTVPPLPPELEALLEETFRAGAGEETAVPAGPGAEPQAREQTAADRLLRAVVELATRAVTEGKADVKVSGTKLLASDAAAGAAAFDLTRIVRDVEAAPSESAPASRVEGAGNRPAPILEELAPAIAFQQAPVVELPDFPELPAFEPVQVAAETARRVTPLVYRGSLSGFAQPMGVATDPARGRLYVTEGGGQRRTIALSAEGQVLAALAPPGTNEITRTPVYVAVAPSGDVYISDRRRDTVDIWSPEFEYRGQLTGPPGGWAPLGMTFDPAGTLYVTNLQPGEHGVVVVAPDGTITRQLGVEGAEPGEFSFPNAVVPDPDRGVMYVSDGNNARVQVLGLDGSFRSVMGRGGSHALGVPRGMTLDPEDRLFIVDTLGHAVDVYQVAPEIEYLYTLGEPGMEEGQFNFPNDIARDELGRFYVADTHNNRVQVWSEP